MTSQQVRFGPRESRGWLLGMTTPQLLLGVVAAVHHHQDPRRRHLGWARVGWVLVAAGCLTVAFLPLRGRTIVEYVPVVANFWAPTAHRPRRLPRRCRSGCDAADRSAAASCCPAISPTCS